MGKRTDRRLVTVCDKCLRACCWQGDFMCDEAKNAGTVDKPVSELRALALEHPDYWEDKRRSPSGEKRMVKNSIQSVFPLAEDLTLHAISAEVLKARTKHPSNRHMLAALVEEVGELAQALLQGKSKDEIDKEAIQVACVAVRIIEEGDADFADGEKGKK